MHKIRRAVKKITAVLIPAVMALLLLNIPAYALSDWPSGCYCASEGACLIDGDSRVVLFGKNSNDAFYPASITKVLTALLVLENCDNLSETVEFSFDAVHMEEENSTIIGASEGDRLSVLDCLYSLMFQSANEVANALAEHIGAKHRELKQEGDDDRAIFVRMMNAKAESLGCLGSHFNNPSGLPDPDHYTTPYDMCLIMAAAIENPAFADIESRSYWTHGPIRRYPDANDPWNTVYQKHSMLKKNSAQYYEGTIAGKTGYTVNAGNTLVTACRREGMTLVACVMNAHANHYNDTRRLFDFGFENFSSVRPSDYDSIDRLVAADFTINKLPVIDSYTLAADPESRITIPRGGDYYEVTKQLFTDDTGDANVLGVLKYYYGERTVGQTVLSLKSLGGMQEVIAAGEDPLLSELAGMTVPETEPSLSGNPEEEKTDSDPGTDPGESAIAKSGEKKEADLVKETAGDKENEPESGAGNGTLAEGGSAAAKGADETQPDDDRGGAKNVFTISALFVVLVSAVLVYRQLRPQSDNNRRYRRRHTGFRP